MPCMFMSLYTDNSVAIALKNMCLSKRIHQIPYPQDKKKYFLVIGRNNERIGLIRSTNLHLSGRFRSNFHPNDGFTTNEIIKQKKRYLLRKTSKKIVSGIIFCRSSSERNRHDNTTQTCGVQVSRSSENLPPPVLIVLF